MTSKTSLSEVGWSKLFILLSIIPVIIFGAALVLSLTVCWSAFDSSENSVKANAYFAFTLGLSFGCFMFFSLSCLGRISAEERYQKAKKRESEDDYEETMKVMRSPTEEITGLRFYCFDAGHGGRNGFVDHLESWCVDVGEKQYHVHAYLQGSTLGSRRHDKNPARWHIRLEECDGRCVEFSQIPTKIWEAALAQIQEESITN